ncbi:porin [Janthinobacterium fluminis]|uniref:Porin n=1 Tax=Janthinobacterium fluminis TaxID=2987524 RepID=A0ABT5K3U0_9BURK|nr:porin [Janthinobacterium fluminis]MDC8759073.1 porin [Janthinobacterium fluminis]
MKKTASSLVALAALSAAFGAQAQSNVSVYGLIDAGVDNTSNAPTSTRVSSGGMNTSRWGIRGNEDLGNGLKAVFNLEGGILLDSGNSDGVLFKRQAYVGLDGAFGRVVVGRSFTSVYDFVLPFDPMAYAPSYSWATSGNATTKQGKFGMNTAFDNLVKYTGQAGDFKFGATYGFGEQSSGAADSAKYALAATYAIGPVTLLATYEAINGNTVAPLVERDKTRTYHLGAMYSNGPLKVQAALRDYKMDPAKIGSPDVKGTMYWAGVNYQSTPAITLTGALYYQNVKNVAAGADADPIMYVARLKYALSKRTDLYVAAAYAKAKNGQLVGLSRDDAGLGGSQRGIITGIQHRF